MKQLTKVVPLNKLVQVPFSRDDDAYLSTPFNERKRQYLMVLGQAMGVCVLDADLASCNLRERRIVSDFTKWLLEARRDVREDKSVANPMFLYTHLQTGEVVAFIVTVSSFRGGSEEVGVSALSAVVSEIESTLQL